MPTPDGDDDTTIIRHHHNVPGEVVSEVDTSAAIFGPLVYRINPATVADQAQLALLNALRAVYPQP